MKSYGKLTREQGKLRELIQTHIRSSLEGAMRDIGRDFQILNYNEVCPGKGGGVMEMWRLTWDG